MFRNAIVRIPCQNIINGITSSDKGSPDYGKAYKQHSVYIQTLMHLGLNVRTLECDERYPDSTFIEDVAICTPLCAIVTSPGAVSRRGEIICMKHILKEYYESVKEIYLPGTLDAGDVMMAGNHFFIGISTRTNNEGADQLIAILEKYKMSGSKIPLKNMLHLKSGVSYLENNNLLIYGELINNKEFKAFNKIIVSEGESYAANSLWINGKVLIPDGYPDTRRKVEKAGYETFALDVSEFRKVDGGLSCLSLRF